MIPQVKGCLTGYTNIKYLVDNGCKIWNGDAYKNYKAKGGKVETEEDFIDKIKGCDDFAQKWGELGPIYGNQWRAWGSQTQHNYITKETKVTRRGIDQIRELITNIKENPDSRRLMVSAWNVSEIDNVVLPPCHYGFQCYVNDGKLSLMWNQRSVDTFLGLPFNIASYGTLLLLLCEETGLEAGELIGNLGDTHLYLNHIQQAKEQINREPYQLPTIEIHMSDILNGEFDYELTNYKYHPTIKAPISN
jgi:thymidylate synthase